jgi:YidC/Oxa1 family membrane protein insertase
MNNQGSNTGQLFRLAILAFLGVYMWQTWTAQKNQPQQQAVRTAPALTEAFKGIDRKQGELLTAEAGKAEIKALQQKIASNNKDEYSYWARLRVGLIQQYILNDLELKTRPPNFLGSIFGAFSYTPPEYTVYDEITDHGAPNAVDAQALYQKGNWLWQRAMAKGAKTTPQSAAHTLEQLIHKGRGSSQFLDLKIYVPLNLSSVAAAATASSGPPEFVQKMVRELRETQPSSGLPPGILERINEFHKTTFFYQMFDTVVGIFGKNPTFSYGLAILFFAIVTRLLIQPLTRKQYESMKGMQIIAPEMKKIQDKYKGKNDQQAQVQMMKEIHELQRRHGVNPWMGCGLAVIQMPIFFFFVYPLIQHYEPQMELVHASFLWIQNLAQPDIILLIIYGISMFLSFRLSATPPTDEQQKMMQTMMAFMFPVFFPFVLKSYPSAFTMYWMTFNMVSTIFQWRLMKASDPDKSIIKSLMGTSDAPATETVPSRPVGKSDGNSKSDNKDGKKEVRATEKKAVVKANDPVPPRAKSRNAAGKAVSLDDAEASNGLNGAGHDNGLNGALNGSNGEAGEVGLEQGTANKTQADGSQSGANRNNSQRTRRRRRY